MRRINLQAAEYFHYQLIHSAEGAKARAYLAKRGILEATADRFQLGYAPDEWQALGNHLSSEGHSWQDLLQAGLVIERESEGYYDRFRGRLVFPIRDRGGYVVGFGARALDDSLPKYLNSPQTEIFDKSAVLFGIDQAKDAIREQGFAVIVEGYMDVLMAHQSGRTNVVASMGTALTERQIRVIKKLAKRLVLALDADAAGDQATLRGLQLAKETLDHRAVPVPTARGLIRYEEQLDAEIRVVTLPEGLDPDEVIGRNVDEWDTLIDQALPVIEYYLRAAIARFDLGSPKEKVAAAREILPLIREISSAVERRHYLNVLSGLLRVDERVLEQEMQSHSTPSQLPAQDLERWGKLSAQPGLTFGLERYILMLLLAEPALLAEMNTVLGRINQDALAGEDFAESEERMIFQTLAAHISQHGHVNQNALVEQLGAPLRPAFDHLLGLMENMVILSDEQAQWDAARCALDLRETRLRRNLDELQFLQQDASAQQDAEAAQKWGNTVSVLAGQLARLQKERAQYTSLRSIQTTMGAGNGHRR